MFHTGYNVMCNWSCNCIIFYGHILYFIEVVKDKAGINNAWDKNQAHVNSFVQNLPLALRLSKAHSMGFLALLNILLKITSSFVCAWGYFFICCSVDGSFMYFGPKTLTMTSQTLRTITETVQHAIPKAFAVIESEPWSFKKYKVRESCFSTESKSSHHGPRVRPYFIC